MLVLLATCLAFVTLGSATPAEGSSANAHAMHGRKAKKHRGSGKNRHASKPKKEATKGKKSNPGFEL